MRSDYQYEPHCPNVRSLQDRPVAGSFRIIVSKNGWQTIRCVVSFRCAEPPNTGASGERYLYSEFVKDNIALTIGAEDGNPSFDTNRICYGMEYIRKTPIDMVSFGIAWATDYEGPSDIRTQLAADLF